MWLMACKWGVRVYLYVLCLCFCMGVCVGVGEHVCVCTLSSRNGSKRPCPLFNPLNFSSSQYNCESVSY